MYYIVQHKYFYYLKSTKFGQSLQKNCQNDQGMSFISCFYYISYHQLRDIVNVTLFAQMFP